jgi:hypothetical protein
MESPHLAGEDGYEVRPAVAPPRVNRLDKKDGSDPILGL